MSSMVWPRTHISTISSYIQSKGCISDWDSQAIVWLSPLFSAPLSILFFSSPSLFRFFRLPAALTFSSNRPTLQWASLEAVPNLHCLSCMALCQYLACFSKTRPTQTPNLFCSPFFFFPPFYLLFSFGLLSFPGFAFLSSLHHGAGEYLLMLL